MIALAIQFAIQPIVTKRYAPEGIIRSSVVLMQEAVKVLFACIALHVSEDKDTALIGMCTEEKPVNVFGCLKILAMNFSHV